MKVKLYHDNAHKPLLYICLCTIVSCSHLSCPVGHAQHCRCSRLFYAWYQPSNRYYTEGFRSRFLAAFSMLNLLIDAFTSSKVWRLFIDYTMGHCCRWLRADWSTWLSQLSRSQKCSFHLLLISTMLVRNFVSFDLRGDSWAKGIALYDVLYQR